jgi:hypothetical protein
MTDHLQASVDNVADVHVHCLLGTQELPKTVGFDSGPGQVDLVDVDIDGFAGVRDLRPSNL